MRTEAAEYDVSAPTMPYLRESASKDPAAKDSADDGDSADDSGAGAEDAQ
jgi:hypothetical protein